MPAFSIQSKQKLFTCHPDLQLVFNTVIQYMDCIILEGYRGQEAQDKAFKEGNSKLQWPHGKHNQSPSLAVDVAPYPVDWKNTGRFLWFAGFVMGVSEMLYAQGKISHRLRWGGDFNHNYVYGDDKGLIDLPHFEILMS